jgi:hypothetical protein
VLAAIDDDALFVVCDAERGRGTTEICRLIAGTFHYPASGTALTDAFRTLALTRL